jgi:hypothetical protein
LKTSGTTIDRLKKMIDAGDPRQARKDFENSLGKDLRQGLEKYGDPDVAPHIKVIYLFLTEGYYAALLGDLGGITYDERIVESASTLLPTIVGGFPGSTRPIVSLVGLNDLREALPIKTNQGKTFRDYLIDRNGRGGYDTPKIAAALIKLVRKPYERKEMIIQIDDDVRPNEIGILNLKERYFELIDQDRKFCMSWNYNAIRGESGVRPIDGPDYEELFKYLVNSFSIRLTFMPNPRPAAT